jgi:uncharacterized membrane protein (UPF0136 family)
MATRPARPRPAQAKRAQAAKSVQAAKSAQVQEQKAKPSQQATPAAPTAPTAPPLELRVAAAVQAVEAAGLLVAAGLAAAATADGKSYERSSGIALTLITVATAALFAAFAAGLAKARPWTRTPVVMFQLAIGIWGVFLLTGHHYEWGVPMLLLAAATLVCVFTPRALRALNRPPRQP